MRREDFSMRRLFALRHELSGVLLPPEVHDSVDVPLQMQFVDDATLDDGLHDRLLQPHQEIMPPFTLVQGQRY